MAKGKPSANGSKDSSAGPGFEAKLWLAGDSRSEAKSGENDRSKNMDAAVPSGAKGNRGEIRIDGQNIPAQWRRPFGLATRARRLRQQQPKQSNSTTRRLAIVTPALRAALWPTLARSTPTPFATSSTPTSRADYALANPPSRLVVVTSTFKIPLLSQKFPHPSEHTNHKPINHHE